MREIFNFSSGPATLPEAVLVQVAQEMLDWQGCGHSVLEMSHRGEHFMGIHARAQASLRELMGIPDSHGILFLQGGATLQFTMVPMNLLREGGSADYIETGHWSTKAIAAAQAYGRVNVSATSKAAGYRHVPPRADWQLDARADYVHICLNETIAGVEIFETPDTGSVPLVADVSSTFLSRPLDVNKFALLYGGAQKNIGPAGLTIVIIDKNVLGRARPGTPPLLDYAVHAEADSMLNTPPTFAIYVAGLVFDWLLQQGGVAAIEAINKAKAHALYAAIDASSLYANPIAPPDRSRMNVVFTLADEALEDAFLEGADARGLIQLRGHRSVGGMRASIYNAMPMAGVERLIAWMRDFEKSHA